MEFPFTINNGWYFIISIFGLYIIIQAFLSRRKAFTSQSWSGVQGRIIESRLDKHENIDDGTYDYNAVVRYAYTVLGLDYTNDRVAFGAQSTSRKPAAAVVECYPQDAQVMVYYEPEKTQESVLEKVTQSSWIQVVVGILLLGAGIYLALK